MSSFDLSTHLNRAENSPSWQEIHCERETEAVHNDAFRKLVTTAEGLSGSCRNVSETTFKAQLLQTTLLCGFPKQSHRDNILVKCNNGKFLQVFGRRG
jgi:hypothetical protein